MGQASRPVFGLFQHTAALYNHRMAKLALVYGLRLLPVDELESVENTRVKLRNGKTAGITMHLIEGDTEQDIRRQLLQSLDAFFEFYPEV